MIPRPVEVRAHVPVDFERSSGPWALAGFHSTYVQLFLLCVAFLFCLLLHVVRSLRHYKAGAGSASSSPGLTVGDKELCEPQEDSQLSKQSIPQSSSESAPKRGWWWVDALLGRDTEEEEAVANAARSMVIQTHHQLVWNDPELQGYGNPISYYQPRQQRPPISMAKLIMSRHAHPPRRPRSPPKPTTTTQPQQRSSSRLASACV